MKITTNTGLNSTKDYGIFKSIEGNRVLNSLYLARLTVSIMENNMLSSNPIIINEKMEVIDGQHRLEVAKNNNLEISYIVLPQANIEQVQKLNSNIKIWTLQDYVRSYAIRGYKDYQFIQSLSEEYGFPISTVLQLIMGSTTGSAFNHAKSGKLSLSKIQKETAKKRADILYEIKGFVSQKGSLPRSLIRAVILITDEGQGQKLVKALKDSAVAFVPKITKHEAEAQLRRFLD